MLRLWKNGCGTHLEPEPTTVRLPRPAKVIFPGARPMMIADDIMFEHRGRRDRGKRRPTNPFRPVHRAGCCSINRSRTVAFQGPRELN